MEVEEEAEQEADDDEEAPVEIEDEEQVEIETEETQQAQEAEEDAQPAQPVEAEPEAQAEEPQEPPVVQEKALPAQALWVCAVCMERNLEGTLHPSSACKKRVVVFHSVSFSHSKDAGYLNAYVSRVFARQRKERRASERHR